MFSYPCGGVQQKRKGSKAFKKQEKEMGVGDLKKD